MQYWMKVITEYLTELTHINDLNQDPAQMSLSVSMSSCSHIVSCFATSYGKWKDSSYTGSKQKQCTFVGSSCIFKVCMVILFMHVTDGNHSFL